MFILIVSPDFMSRTVPFWARIDPGSWMKYGIKTARSLLASKVIVCHIPASSESASETIREDALSDFTSLSPKQPDRGVQSSRKTNMKTVGTLERINIGPRRCI
jgi:hypothetical protein